ncbi:hypothetical protein LOZ53_005821 [Ophidiomyces ophidiicola]|nr:hypothetical protein LOZ62_002824 [Ophidiomyces ophidiicola]KAI1983532.1 hypothetical protein LOZ53_005821 [Ophidiomyces ophidiicola]KAI2004467.1 hypothetical protein LOZ50_004285 [Ophidiomyces ophidiicola]KAI2012741.1 hypothetical protein LOZ49_002596 [Ophidiomyces ophidiicola]KAI2031517.1 hypothetical protein LOZ47_006110 [Ophidiomyces ophidiicola]
MVVDAIMGPVAEPDTPEDVENLRQIQEQFDKLPIVKKLRASEDYVEWEAYSNFSPEEKARRLTTGPLRGSRGISTQTIFWNEQEKTATSVLYLGAGIGGWPGLVHGGALATLLDEAMGRVALRSFPARTGVTANLNVNYRKPFFADQFCIITAKCEPEQSNERKAIVKAEIRDSAGSLCTEASSVFVVPRNMTLRSLADGF